MRKLTAAGLAVPILVWVYASAFLRGSVVARLVVLAVAVALVVSGLIVGLPAKSIDALGPRSFAPLSPSAYSVHVPASLGVDEPIQIDFARSMDPASVSSLLTITPPVPVTLSWDSTKRQLSVLGAPHWAPLQYYTVTISGSVVDANGSALGEAVNVVFVTGSLTRGTLAATVMADDRAAPTTAFQITFDHAVPLRTVITSLTVDPLIDGRIVGDDPTDADSHVFTFTPSHPLASGKTYAVSFLPADDSRGVEIAPVTPLVVRTLSGPAVVRFRPVDKASNVDPAQQLSVRFTMPMDPVATAAAFSATADGRPLSGSVRWAENDTVLVFKPSDRLPAGATIATTVTSDARSAAGLPIEVPATATFTTAKAAPAPAAPAATPKPTTKPTTKPIPRSGGGSLGSAPWYGAETYYFRLMNCTRTGGWVTSQGACSSVTHHTLPAARALMLDKGISDKVARPFAKFMADRGILNHYADGSPKDRLRRAGYTSTHWGENIGSPHTGSVMSGMVAEEIFYQNEYPCRCEHYANIMDSSFDRAGVGVWVTSGRVRIVIDFYRP